MRQLFVTLSLALTYSLVFSQPQREVDSLQQVYETSTDIDTRIHALKRLFWSYYFSQPDSALIYATKMDSLASVNNDILGRWTAYNLFGIFNYSQSQFDSACFWFNKGFTLSQDEQYFDQRIYSLNYAGHSYRLKSEYEKADSCFLLFLETVKERNDNYNLARAYKALAINNYTQNKYSFALRDYLIADSLFNDTLHYETAEVLQNIGIIYKSLDNYEFAKRYYVEALSMYEAVNDSYGIYAIENSLGSLELDMGNYQESEKHLKKAFSYYKDFNDQLMAGTVAHELGRAYLHLEDTKLAEQYFRYSIDYLKGIEISQISNAYRGLGDMFKAKGAISKAMIYYDSSLYFAKKSNSAVAIKDVLAAKAQAHFTIGEYATAYNIQEQYHHLSDSLNDIESSKAIHEIEAKYQNDKKGREIALLTTQNQLAKQEKQNQLFLLLGIVLILLIAAIFFFILYRNRQKTTNKLKELDTVKSNFFANISHEFRTPLTLIKGPVQKQLSQEHIGADERENLQMINRNTDRLLSLVDQLLDLSRLESGSLKLKVEKASLSSFSKVIIAPFQYLAEQKNIDFTSDVTGAKNCYFDKDVLEKVVVNLLSNAVKYTPEGGKIYYEQNVNGNWAIINVKNTGASIPKDQQLKIFDRFYQMSEAREGVGIGLALVKELVTLHKGSVRLKGDENEYTSFEVKLPVASTNYSSAELASDMKITREEPAPEVVAQQCVNGANDVIMAEKPIMLIVEDSADLRELIKGLFSSSYSILLAENGEEGIHKAMEYIPDIIISDVMMPIKDGVELSQTLKADERTSHVPIILLTAKAGEENELKGLETGADEYMVKPFNNDILKVRVEKLIELRARLRERYSQEVILRPKDIAITSIDEKFLERVESVIDAHLTKSDFTAEFFSKEIGMSRMQLHRKIKALIGLSTSEFIRSQRLKMATQLLDSSNVNISEVGYAVGFNDPSYFARCFKEAYGCTPTQYASEAKANS